MAKTSGGMQPLETLRIKTPQHFDMLTMLLQNAAACQPSWVFPLELSGPYTLSPTCGRFAGATNAYKQRPTC